MTKKNKIGRPRVESKPMKPVQVYVCPHCKGKLDLE